MVDSFFLVQTFADAATYAILKTNEGSAASALNFFIYDTIKIIMLLFLMITFIGILRTYLSQNKIKSLLGGKNKGFAYIMAAVFGAISPFCSCSSIPIFISFLEIGIPLGITFAFLITSPLINEYIVIVMLGSFGWKITAAYILSGMLIGIVSGIILSRMKLEKYLVEDMVRTDSKEEEKEYTLFKERIDFGLSEATSIVKKVGKWVVIGVGIGAFIHGFIPEDTIQNIIAKGGIFAVPIATVLGVPIYANCASVVPIALALFAKGVPLGTALSFMMATAALSLPEAVILRRAMRLQLILIFFSIVALSIIITGYVFNVIQSILV